MRLDRPRYCRHCRQTTATGWFEDCQVIGLLHSCDWEARALALEEALRQVLSVGPPAGGRRGLDVLELAILERAKALAGPPRDKS